MKNSNAFGTARSRSRSRNDQDYPGRFAPAVLHIDSEPSAEDVYMRQHAAIAVAVKQLQDVLDLMQAPDESVVRINWSHVAEFAHVAAAATTLSESIGA